MNEDKIIEKLVEHDNRLDHIETEISSFHEEFSSFKNDYWNGQDKMMVILTRLDQERIFTVEAVRRLTNELEQHRKEIDHHGKKIEEIKKHLHLS